jgi:hypothetical protein
MNTNLVRMTTLMLAACALTGCTLRQITVGQIYVIDTPAQGACPRLAWTFAQDPQHTITGHIEPYNHDERIANLSGHLNPDETFRMTATHVGDQRTAEVTGQFTSGISTIAIHGDGITQACDGQTFKLRLGGYFNYKDVGYSMSNGD